MKTIYLKVYPRTWFSDPAIAVLKKGERVNALDFGIAVTVSIADGSEEIKHWDRDQTADLWRYLNSASMVAGFDLEGFDLPVLRNRAMCELPVFSQHFKTFDLCSLIKGETGRWYTLSHLGIYNLSFGTPSMGEDIARLITHYDPHDVRDTSLARAYAYAHQDIRVIVGLHTTLSQGNPLLLASIPNRDWFDNLYFWTHPTVRSEVADPAHPIEVW